MSEKQAEINIRTMQVMDIKAVLNIERQAYPIPWTVGLFRDCLRAGYSCWVMTKKQQILGYGIIMLAAGEAHILNICISPAKQNKGLGRLLLRHLVDKSKQTDIDMVLLEVRRSNTLAHQLYSSEGFHELGVRKAYYPTEKGREDAIILAKYLAKD